MNEEPLETAGQQVAETKPAEVKKTVKKATKKPKAAKGKKAVKKSAKTKGKAKAKAKPVKPAKPSKKANKGVVLSKFPRHPKNPFREGSAYSAIFDAFVTKKNGIRRDELTKLAMEATGKDMKHSSYNLAVILSAKDSNTGSRHQSCREGFFVEREGDHLTLKID
jgi:hypothetical protein